MIFLIIADCFHDRHNDMTEKGMDLFIHLGRKGTNYKMNYFMLLFQLLLHNPVFLISHDDVCYLMLVCWLLPGIYQQCLCAIALVFMPYGNDY